MILVAVVVVLTMMMIFKRVDCCRGRLYLKYNYVIKAASFPINNFNEFKIQMLNWASRFNIFCLLDNHQYQFETPAFECLLAAGCKTSLQVNTGNAFEQLKKFSQQNTGWLFGHFGYDLKNELEALQSSNEDGIGFSDLHFFVPQFVLELSKVQLNIYCETDAQQIFDAIKAAPKYITPTNPPSAVLIKNKISKERYIESVKEIQEHILRGDCYEINFCQEFFAKNASINPLAVYQQLTAISPSPFAVLYKVNNHFCISASPERYLKKTGDFIISQPIKGTAKRNLENPETDEKNKLHLLNSVKEISENVMVVDLVRNDLSKICREGTVEVSELFAVYSFPQVHQMISTVRGLLNEGIDWVDAIEATFPMGSMTGAPKKKVMELIEQFEQTKRGLFSGAIGYINPNGNFDFNVVIRSILYNAVTKYLSFQTGGAITFHSIPSEEYDECLLKAAAIKKVLEQIPATKG